MLRRSEKMLPYASPRPIDSRQFFLILCIRCRVRAASKIELRRDVREALEGYSAGLQSDSAPLCKPSHQNTPQGFFASATGHG